MEYASVIASPIGAITIIAEDGFISEITFAEKAVDELIENDLTKQVAAQLNAYFKGELKKFDFPMRQKGTEFQQRVWEDLLRIPYGETTTYAKFSAHKPLAIRAIAAANGKNNIAVVVPCHRVIGSNGKLVGYAGGLWRKQWLLQHEREMEHKGQTEIKF